MALILTKNAQVQIGDLHKELSSFAEDICVYRSVPARYLIQAELVP